MAITMYRASVPVFVQYLTAFSTILTKAAEHCAARKIDPSVLVSARLSPDMFALARQVQIATDHAKGAAARLSGREVPSYPDTEATFEDLKARVAKTLDYVQSVKESDFEGSDDKEIVLKAGGQERHYTGIDYLTTFALPNFFFHITTAYGILRHCGVEIGKRDFMGVK
jgi:hypothetical protein